jgi:hypothetical protein
VWAVFLGWLGVLIVAIQTQKERERIKREEVEAEEAESGEGIETQKLRKFGLIESTGTHAVP